ncbi:MAG: glutathione-disulfide reductase [Cyanobacteriota bacterium]|nr:glutathione-disulfide reductase [Cyanobacteriota bacterium]
MSYDYDLLVIGAGSGGLAAAKQAGNYGAKVGIIEEDRVGGTCAVRGCIPKKLLLYASGFSHLYKDAVGYGWEAAKPNFNWPTLAENVDRQISHLSQLQIDALEKAGAELIRGKAAFVDAHTLAVGDRQLSADRILIATGSKPKLPDLPGIEHAISSNKIFTLPAQPKRMAIVGGGYIGVEFAGIFNGLGSEVIQLVRGDNILRGFDEEIRTHLHDAMVDRGITILTDTETKGLEKTADGTRIFLKGENAPESITVDTVVLFATGRNPNIDDLALEKASVETDSGAVVVNEWSQTNQSHIYAVGDAVDRVNLTPVAIEAGRAFVDTVFGNTPRQVNYTNIPTAVFSQPETGTVGLTEAEAKEEIGEENVKVYRSTFGPLFYSLTEFEEKTLMKLVVDGQSDRILGVHMVGKDAAEIIQSVAIAMNMGATKQDFDKTMALHPSTAEEFVTMT